MQDDCTVHFSYNRVSILRSGTHPHHAGALRQHWRTVLQQKLSQQRAEERRQAEETRRLFNEEVEEEEAEMTDPGQS